MSTDRLTALLRQRELVAQHLAWLDREIAEARGDTPASAPASAPATLPVEPAVADAAASAPPPNTDEPDPVTVANARANEILERYAATDRFDADSTRRGCLLFAVATLVLGLGGLFLIYVLRYR